MCPWVRERKMTMRKLIAFVAVAASAMLPSYAARTVEVSAYDDATREVSLAFGGSSSAAENVYIVYGPADCGGHFHKWPNNVNIGTIATDATSMTYVLPAAVTTGVYYRFFLSRDITISEGPQFHVDGSSTTIINPGTDLLDRLMDISSIVKEYYKKGNK